MEDPQSGAVAPHDRGARQDGDYSDRQGRIANQGSGAIDRNAVQDSGAEGHPQSESGKRSRRRRRRKRGQSRDVAVPITEIAAKLETGKPRRRRRRRGTGSKPSSSNTAALIAGPEHAQPVAANTAAALISSPASPLPRSDLFAALDLGTNNCRLLIAAPTRPGQFRVVDAFSRIVRLGEGLTATSRLSEAAMDRAVEALKICHAKLASRKIFQSRLIATEACRSAENGEAFLERVRTETGLDLEIVDRETEARLAVSGCGPLVNREIEALVLFDIGGGSSEIALIDIKHKKSPHLADHIIAWTSLPVGVVSLAERYGGKNVNGETYQAMVDDVLGMIEKFSARHILGVRAKGEKFHLLGTSGTVTTLAGIHLGLERYDRRQVDGLWMDDEQVTAMTDKLRSWTFDDRVNNACIGAERADLVLGGCAILDAIRITWPSSKLRVADRGLREGLLTEMMSTSGVWRRRTPQEANA